MKKFIKSTLLAAVLFAGCNDFGDMNVDPNNPSIPKPDLLLSASISYVSSITGGTNTATTGTNRDGIPVTTLYVQYFSETQYTDESRYSSDQFDFTSYYTGPLMNLQEILNSDAADNYKAVARIMKAYFFQILVDRWGPVPYFEALKPAETFSPDYDSVELIYKDLIKEWKEAANALTATGGTVRGDLLFGGDIAKWKQFANTLRMNAALRLSDADQAYAKVEFADAYSNGVITSDVMYVHLNENINASPWYLRYITRTDYAISKTLADLMQANGDLRLTKFADPAPDVDNGDGVVEMSEIVAMEYGLTENDASQIENAAISFPGMAIRSQNAALPVFTVAQVQFGLAEARQRGWVAGNAADAYYAGIDASWAQWGITDAAALAAYKALPAVAYDAANYKRSIGTQKWIAMYPNGYEAWAEWRRLDFPALTPTPNALNQSKTIPVRQMYPTNETQINAQSYANGVTKLGGPDLQNTKIWWDKN